MHCVIDAEQMIYACGFASKGEPLSHTLKLIKNKIEEIIKHSGADTYQVYIEGKGNFREEIAFTKGYKANRKAEKPPTFEDCKEYMRNVWGAIEVEGMETDDQVSILLYENFALGLQDVILSSPDKDLKNTPGWHYYPATKEKVWISENQAMRHFCFQLLTGDGVDNIPGLPYTSANTRAVYGIRKTKGCGKVSAKKILAESATWEIALEDVVVAYLSWGEEEGMSEVQTLEYFMEQARLLWMVRELDSEDKPVMFELSEEIYDRARDRIPKYSTGY